MPRKRCNVVAGFLGARENIHVFAYDFFIIIESITASFSEPGHSAKFDSGERLRTAIRRLSMRRSPSLKLLGALAPLTTLAVVSVACGGSSSPNVSQAQAQAISQEIFTALGSALAAGLTPPGSPSISAPRSLASAIPTRPALQSSGCTITDSGQSCNIPITYQGNCPNGGSIAVAGDFIFTLDNAGNGSDNSTLTIIPTNCAVSDITFNGNPSVTVSTSFNLENNALAFPLSFSEKGGITFGPKPSGSCSMNVSVTVTSSTSCTASGSVCGHSVSGSC